MRAVLANARFRRLWFSAIGVALGDAFMQMGLLEVFRAHHYDERVETAKMLFAVSLPGLLFGPFAMAYLDRWQAAKCNDGERRVPRICGRRHCRMAATPCHGTRRERHLLVVYMMIFVIGAITTFYYPRAPRWSRISWTPKCWCLRILCLQRVSLWRPSAAVRSWIRRGTHGCGWAVMANALAYIGSVGIIWGLRVEPHASVGEQHESGWSELKTGLVYLLEHRMALPLVLLSAAFCVSAGGARAELCRLRNEYAQAGTGGLGYSSVPAARARRSGSLRSGGANRGRARVGCRSCN